VHFPFPLRIAGLALGAAAAALAADAKTRAPETGAGPTVRMQPFVVMVPPVTSFGLGLAIFADPQTRQIKRMFIKAVTADSEADMLGLTAGTEILNVDGKSVSSFVIRFNPDSELSRLFINRRRGDRIRLVVASPPDRQPRTVVLTQGRSRMNGFPWAEWEMW
jgi:S1-C subfamily serine protease